jgi:hypothetical protein
MHQALVLLDETSTWPTMAACDYDDIDARIPSVDSSAVPDTLALAAVERQLRSTTHKDIRIGLIRWIAILDQTFARRREEGREIL